MRPAGISTSGLRRARWTAVLLLACALPVQALDDAPPLRTREIALRRLAVPDGVAARLATAFAEDRAGFLWIGTGDGLVRFDGTRFKVFRSRPGDPATLGDDDVRALAAAADGRLWVGTAGGGLSVYDPATEAFTRFRHDPQDPNSLSHDHIWGLAEDRFGRIWVATPGGLDRLNPRTGRLRHFRHEPFDPASLASDRVGAVLADSKGRIWVGSRGGLQVWRGSPAGAEGGRQGRFERVASAPGSDSLAGQLVVRLFEDWRGNIWVGTAQHGAAVVDPGFGSLHRLPIAPIRTEESKPIQGFAAAGQDEVWIATAGGVAVVDLDSLRLTGRLRHDPAQPGTPASDDVRALLADRAGGAWLGAWGGGIARHDRLPPATYEPPLAAIALQVDGVERPGAASLPKTGLTLGSGAGFRLDVAVLDFAAPEKAVYRHRLEGFDRTWSGTTRGMVVYADLPPGSYELHVQGTDHAGRWSPHELIVPVTVRPALYQTTRFRTGLLVLVLAVLAAVVRVWVRRRRAVARHY